MAGSVTTLEVDDPHEITPTTWKWFWPTPNSAISPPQFLARDYRAGDWRRYQIDRDSYHTTVSIGKLDPVCFVRMADREATDMVIGSPGLDHYCLTVLLEGNGILNQPGRAAAAELGSDSAAIFQGEPLTVLRTDTKATKINVWIPAGLLRRQASMLLEGRDIDGIDFAARIDTRSGAGASLRRLTAAIFTELTFPDSPVVIGLTAKAAQELFLQAIVLAATHDRSAVLRRGTKPPAPAIVRRAEEYMRSRAEDDLNVEDVANAAGCSVRTLQVAFRRFRGTSPMAALRRLRLELAHQALMRADVSHSVSDVAAQYGFTNLGRFANLYRRSFGEYPLRALRSSAGTPTAGN